MSYRILTLLAALLMLALVAPLGGALVALPPEPAFERIRVPVAPEFDPIVVSAHAPLPGAAKDLGPGTHLFMRFPEEPGSLYACTANFVWKSGSRYFLGAAGHCFLPGDKAATHGPGADYDASGVRVQACIDLCQWGGQMGFSARGTVVDLGEVAYARQTGAGGDVGNDFGLVEVPAALVGSLRFTEPVWQGPTHGIREVQLGATLCLYGNAAGFGEHFTTMARPGVGVSHTTTTGRWNGEFPSFQGDSGSAILTCERDDAGFHGKYASGILTHLAPPFVAGTTMAKAKQMATQANLAIEAQLPPSP